MIMHPMYSYAAGILKHLLLKQFDIINKIVSKFISIILIKINIIDINKIVTRH